MLDEELYARILAGISPHQPTEGQRQAALTVGRFLADRDDRVAMVLRGSAGTGKTTLAAAIVKALRALKQKALLMAPTGRAAKVFSLYAESPAFIIFNFLK